MMAKPRKVALVALQRAVESLTHCAASHDETPTEKPGEEQDEVPPIFVPRIVKLLAPVEMGDMTASDKLGTSKLRVRVSVPVEESVAVARRLRQALKPPQTFERRLVLESHTVVKLLVPAPIEIRGDVAVVAGLAT